MKLRIVQEGHRFYLEEKQFLVWYACHAPGNDFDRSDRLVMEGQSVPWVASIEHAIAWAEWWREQYDRKYNGNQDGKPIVYRL